MLDVLSGFIMDMILLNTKAIVYWIVDAATFS
jgi:hypothetical protein